MPTLAPGFSRGRTRTVLNRIYIVVGIFAIVVLTGAFVAPFFIQWADYRDRMEALASTVLGADVTIRGDISFSFLPSPRLEFADVVVGDVESPSAHVASVEAEFALFEFLRDNYNVTALTLVQPAIELVLDENGLFSSGVDLTGAASSVVLGHARIANGSIRLTDLRADEAFSVARIDGDLRLSSFTGPFQFQGAADYDGQRYDVRFNAAASDAVGANRVSAFLREAGGAYSVTGEGLLTPGMAPRFEGTITYKQAPPIAEAADDIRGALVLESAVSVSTDRVILSGYTLHPDENRAGMRLTGSANIQLGARRGFDAVLSGGVFSLPPRPATEVPAELPYELVRFLSEIPAPPLPPMPGTLDVDLAEVGLRGFSLRELRLDASTDGQSWQIEQAVASLPGDSEVRLSGTVTNEDGHAGFKGDFVLNAHRLDGLAQLWRRAGDNNPLFNRPGALTGRLLLAGDAFGLSNGRLDFGGQTHMVEMRIGFGEEKRLDSVVQLGQLNAPQTAALLALLPDAANDGSFAVSFPNGSFSVSAQVADVLGLAAHDLAVEGQWAPGDLRLPKLSTSDWGGVSFDGALRLAGSLTEPVLTGSGQMVLASAEAEGLGVLYEMVGMPFGWQEGLANIWPADLQFILSNVGDGPAQVLTLAGDLGAAALDLRAEMAAGLAGLSSNDLRLIVSLEAEDGLAAQDQFGLSNVPLFDEDGAVLASLFMEGNAADGYEGRAAISQGGQSASYFGSLDLAANGEISGQGTLDVLLAAGGGIAALAGVEGAGLPDIEASAALDFAGWRQFTLTDIAGVSGDSGFSGALSMQILGELPSFTGSLHADKMDAAGLAIAMFGNAAIGVPGEGVWPDGPLAVDPILRMSRGDIAVTSDAVQVNGASMLGETRFAYVWTPESVSIERLVGQASDGRLTLNLVRCCAGALSERSLTGAVSLEGVDIDTFNLPALGIAGIVDGGLQFEGNGQSIAELVRRLTGEGNFAISGFSATGLSPAVFPTLAGIEDPLNIDEDALQTLIALGLSQGGFAASEARGAFTIAGGAVRIANLIIEGAGGRLSGNLNVALSQMGLDGLFVLMPRDYVDVGGLIETETARILARIGGTVFAPLVTLDLAEMVAAIQVRANELELERLDILRLEDEARQRAAAEERNRLAEEQRRRAAEEAARRAAEEEALRLEQERLLLEQNGGSPAGAPIDLGFPTNINPQI